MHRPQIQVLLAFFATYVVWGSTYMAIAIGLQSIPPLLLMALRSLGGGLILLAWSISRGAATWSWRLWLHAGICGIFFFVGCHGVLALVQRHVPSGAAAVILATIPFWMVLTRFVVPGAIRPRLVTVLALIPGFAGVAFIAWRQMHVGEGGLDLASIGLLLGSALSWAIGSRISQANSKTIPSTTLSAMQLVVGGLALVALSGLTHEWRGFSPYAISFASATAVTYLVLAGTVFGFVAYVWLLDNVAATLVTTYTFVNPVVAVILGWLFLREHPSADMLVGALLVVGSVFATWLTERKSNGQRNTPAASTA
jgi:drug/metabolite transporter (DMT)-like permease